MEIGNLIFGNSRGEHAVPRGEGWEDALRMLFDAYAPGRDSSWREYGMEFENDTFSVFPYYWGECKCGYDEREHQWCAENSHDEGCYQTELVRARDSWLSGNPEPEFGTRLYKKWFRAKETEETDIYDRLCAKFGVDRKRGCAVHCTCTYDKRLDEWMSANTHAADCPIIRPNFLYKPTGFAIKWYKYPFRDSYMNKRIILREFGRIVVECIKSLEDK